MASFTFQGLFEWWPLKKRSHRVVEATVHSETSFSFYCAALGFTGITAIDLKCTSKATATENKRQPSNPVSKSLG